jgi:hypothetical protein
MTDRTLILKKSLGLLGFVLIFAVQANSASAVTFPHVQAPVSSNSSALDPAHHAKAYIAAEEHRIGQELGQQYNRIREIRRRFHEHH